MGDPKKPKKKYRKPLMIWNEERIAKDKILMDEFGLKNKREIWKAESKLKSIHDQVKKLIADTSNQGKKESEQLINKLTSQNLISGSSKPEDVLSLTEEDLLNRRLQTLVFKKGLSRTIKQARQFITHNHISINGQVVNTPSYIVKISEESKVTFNPSSAISNEAHAERPKDEDLAKVKQAKEQAHANIKATIKKEDAETPKKEIKKVQPEQKKTEDLPKKEQLENVTPEEKTPHKEK
jgi:small subunit ribosomal protein S4